MSLENLSFSKGRRLNTRADFSAVFELHSYKKSYRHSTVLAKAGARGEARLGMVVAKRHVKAAVARNRIKRFIREAFRLQQRRLAGLDIVVVVRDNFGGLNTASKVADKYFLDISEN